MKKYKEEDGKAKSLPPKSSKDRLAARKDRTERANKEMAPSKNDKIKAKLKKDSSPVTRSAMKWDIKKKDKK